MQTNEMNTKNIMVIWNEEMQRYKQIVLINTKRII
jgi:hypothetical protein